MSDISNKPLVHPLLGSIDEALLRLRSEVAIDCAELGFWDWHIPSGEAVFNSHWASMLGYDLDEIAQDYRTWERLLHPDDYLRAYDILGKHLKGEIPQYQCELRMLHKQGHWHWIKTSGKVYERGPNGEPIRASGVHVDVHQSKLAEEESDRLLNLLGHMEEIATIGAWEFELGAEGPFWSEGVYRIHERDASKGRPTLEEAIGYYAPEARKVIETAVHEGLEQGTPWDVELPLITETGKNIWVRSLGKVCRDSAGKVLKLSGSFQDISARKSQEEKLKQSLRETERAHQCIEEQAAVIKQERDIAQSASAAKSMFLANMSHEIRTPMNGVLGMLELLQETNLDAVQLEYAKIAAGSAKTLVKIINDILDFSRIEAGKLSLVPEPMELCSLINELEQMFYLECERRQVTMVTLVDPRLEGTFEADQLRIRQVLINLLANALKFNLQGGGIVVQVAQVSSIGNVPRVRFSVADSGVGITENARRLIFNSFEQADAGTTRQFGGTGLGLAISSRLVELLGGQIEVESKIGIGSRFSFEIELPRLESDLETIDTGAFDPSPPAQPLNILLAEDNHVNQRLAQIFLENAGHRVTLANNGKEAVELFSQAAFDLILMDIQMPEMGGEEATILIRSKEGGDTVPIVAFTANAFDSDRERYIGIGMNGFVTKPLDKGKLLASVNSVVRDN